MVVYATAVGASVGAMFMGGIIPGILCGVVLMGVVLLRDRTQHFPRQTEKIDKAEKRKIILDGIMTPTEAGAVSVVYSLFVSLFVIKTLKIREIGPILLQAVNSTGPLLLIIACARVFSYGLTALKMPVLVNDLILSLTSSKYAFLLLVNVLLLIMGMFMDGGASVIILAPILAPVAASLGISLVHFGIIMAFNLTIGNITPPLDYCMFITAKIAGIPVEKAIKGTVPYIIAEFLVLLAITYIDVLVTAIPVALGFTV